MGARVPIFGLSKLSKTSSPPDDIDKVCCACWKNQREVRAGKEEERRERRIDVSNVMFPDKARALKTIPDKGGLSTALLCVLGDSAYEMSQSYHSTGHRPSSRWEQVPLCLFLHFWIAVFYRVVVLSRVSLANTAVSAPLQRTQHFSRLTRLPPPQETGTHPYLR